MYLWTRKSTLNFGSHPELVSGPRLDLPWQRTALAECSCFSSKCRMSDAGDNLIHQLTLIVNTLGTPDMDFVSLAHADRIKDFLLSKCPMYRRF